MKVGLKIIETKNSKLATIKAVKFNLPGIGLREAKQFCESGEFKVFEIPYDNYLKLKEDLEATESEYVLSNNYDTRNLKILKLGLGEKEDFEKFISEHIAIEVISLNHKDRIEFFKKLYSKLDIKELKNIFKELDEGKNW